MIAVLRVLAGSTWCRLHPCTESNKNLFSNHKHRYWYIYIYICIYRQMWCKLIEMGKQQQLSCLNESGSLSAPLTACTSQTQILFTFKSHNHIYVTVYLNLSPSPHTHTHTHAHIHTLTHISGYSKQYVHRSLPGLIFPSSPTLTLRNSAQRSSLLILQVLYNQP